MKKLIMMNIIIGLFTSYLNADYLMTLTNKDGTEISECIKSYSYTNYSNFNINNTRKKDIYSENETLTNKIYFGKPVYRRTIKVTNLQFNKYLNIEYTFDHSTIEKIINSNFIWSPTTGGVSYYQSNTTSNYRTMFWATKSGWGYYFGIDRYNVHKWNNSIEFTIEYTKITDEVQNLTNENSYLKYVLSSSDGSIINFKKLKDTEVKILPNYEYNSESQTCNKKSN